MICGHTSRVAGITTYLMNGGTIEATLWINRHGFAVTHDSLAKTRFGRQSMFPRTPIFCEEGSQ